MSQRRREIRGIYGDYSFLITVAVGNALQSKRAASVRPGMVVLYQEDVDSIWKLLPPRAQGEARAMLGGDLEAVIRMVEEECGRMSDEFSHPRLNRERCNMLKKRALDSVFGVLLKLMHKYGILTRVRDVRTGREEVGVLE